MIIGTLRFKHVDTTVLAITLNLAVMLAGYKLQQKYYRRTFVLRMFPEPSRGGFKFWAAVTLELVLVWALLNAVGIGLAHLIMSYDEFVHGAVR